MMFPSASSGNLMGKKNAELKSPAKSEKLLTLKKPIAVAQWIAQIASGFDIARILFIFCLNHSRLKLAQI